VVFRVEFVSVFTEVNQEMLLSTEVTVWIFGRVINEKYVALKLTGLGIYALSISHRKIFNI